MSRTVHQDTEMKPPANVLLALKEFLVAMGLRQVTLAKFLRARKSRVTRLFAGEAYLSATQRRAIEEFTGGAITAAMLEGKAPLLAKVQRRQPTQVERAAEKLAAEILAAIIPMIAEVVREDLLAGRDIAGAGGER